MVHEPTVVQVIGIPIAKLQLTDLFDYFMEAVRRPSPAAARSKTVAYANAHSCNLASENAAYRRALQQVDLIYLDGNGPRLAAWLAGHRLPPRMTAPDWFDDLCRLFSREGYSVYFVGGHPGVASKAAATLVQRHPELQIVGTEDGYFDPSSSEDIVRRINRARPDLLLLGMGSPRQELWMIEYRDRLGVPLIWTAGGLLDYLAGRLRRAPAWMRALGLEWLGRFLLEPRRLSRRYLLGIPLFLWRAAGYALRDRRSQALAHPDS